MHCRSQASEELSQNASRRHHLFAELDKEAEDAAQESTLMRRLKHVKEPFELSEGVSPRVSNRVVQNATLELIQDCILC